MRDLSRTFSEAAANRQVDNKKGLGKMLGHELMPKLLDLRDSQVNVKTLDNSKKTKIWNAVNCTHEINIEIFVPQEIRLTDSVKNTLIEINKTMSQKGKNLEVRRYRPVTLLDGLKDNKNGSKRIVITNDEIKKSIEEFLKDDSTASLFRDVRMLNINAVKSLNKQKNTAYQYQLFMTAILSRLIEKNTMYFLDIKQLLTEMLNGSFSSNDVNIADFIDNLSTKEDDATKISDIKERIRYFMSDGRAISLIKNLEIELRAIKEFWTYA